MSAFSKAVGPVDNTSGRRSAQNSRASDASSGQVGRPMSAWTETSTVSSDDNMDALDASPLPSNTSTGYRCTINFKLSWVVSLLLCSASIVLAVMLIGTRPFEDSGASVNRGYGSVMYDTTEYVSKSLMIAVTGVHELQRYDRFIGFNVSQTLAVLGMLCSRTAGLTSGIYLGTPDAFTLIECDGSGRTRAPFLWLQVTRERGFEFYSGPPAYQSDFQIPRGFFDPTARPWYKSAQEKGGINFSPIYTFLPDAATGEVIAGLTLSSPVAPDRPAEVLGFDIKLGRHVFSLLKEKCITTVCDVMFILDNRNAFLASSDSRCQATTNLDLSNCNNTIIHQAYAVMAVNYSYYNLSSTGPIERPLGDQRVLGQYVRVLDDIEWLLVMVTSPRAITDPIDEVSKRNTVAGAVIAVISFVFMVAVTVLIVRWMHYFEENSSRLAQLDLDRVETDWMRQIYLLELFYAAEAFVILLRDLLQYRTFLPQTLFERKQVSALEVDDEDDQSSVSSYESSASTHGTTTGLPGVSTSLASGSKPKIGPGLTVTEARVTVVWVWIIGDAHYREKNFKAIFGRTLDAISAMVREHGGVFDAVVGDRVFLTFNAASSRTGHYCHASLCAHRIAHSDELSESGFHARCGVATGISQCGTFGGVGSRRFAIISPTPRAALVLCRASRFFGCQTLVLYRDCRALEWKMLVRIVGVVNGDLVAELMGEITMSEPLDQAAEEKEWMYQVGEMYTAHNQACQYVASGALEDARRVVMPDALPLCDKTRVEAYVSEGQLPSVEVK